MTSAQSTELSTFGRNLRRCRTDARVTQEQLAERLDVHGTEVAMLETGRRAARVDTLVKLAEALAVEPEELLRGMGSKRSEPVGS